VHGLLFSVFTLVALGCIWRLYGNSALISAAPALLLAVLLSSVLCPAFIAPSATQASGVTSPYSQSINSFTRWDDDSVVVFMAVSFAFLAAAFVLGAKVAWYKAARRRDLAGCAMIAAGAAALMISYKAMAAPSWDLTSAGALAIASTLLSAAVFFWLACRTPGNTDTAEVSPASYELLLQ
jgi:hypothetical protein